MILTMGGQPDFAMSQNANLERFEEPYVAKAGYIVKFSLQRFRKMHQNTYMKHGAFSLIETGV